MIRSVAPGGLTEAGWSDFFRRISDPVTPPLLQEASGTVEVDHPRHHLQVIARATLLLRVSTGACALMLDAAGVGRSDLEFWWRSLGEDRGLWEPGDEPDEFIDLWSDVNHELDNSEEWETSPSAGTSFASWRKEQSHTIAVLGGCERIALWGLGL